MCEQLACDVDDAAHGGPRTVIDSTTHRNNPRGVSRRERPYAGSANEPRRRVIGVR